VWCNIARVVFHIIFDHSIIVKIQRFVGINWDNDWTDVCLIIFVDVDA
jgi:hypothetical protein